MLSKEACSLDKIDLEIDRLQAELGLSRSNQSSECDPHQVGDNKGFKDEQRNVHREISLSPAVAIVPPSTSNKEFINIHSSRLRSLSYDTSLRGLQQQTCPEVADGSENTKQRRESLGGSGGEADLDEEYVRTADQASQEIQIRSFRFRTRKRCD